MPRPTQNRRSQILVVIKTHNMIREAHASLKTEVAKSQPMHAFKKNVRFDSVNCAKRMIVIQRALEHPKTVRGRHALTLDNSISAASRARVIQRERRQSNGSWHGFTWMYGHPFRKDGRNILKPWQHFGHHPS